MDRAEQISRRLKLRQLEVLIAVAQSGSMAGAAAALAITQPVVSKTIADLEGTLGSRLLDRNRRGVELTPYGRALVQRSIAVFNDLRTGVSELEFLSDPTAGELRLGSSDAVAAGMLGLIIDRIARRHPRVTFEVTLGGGLTDLQYSELQARNLDLIIGRLPKTIPDAVETQVLYMDPSFVVAGASNKWARRRKIDLAELVDQSWCLPPLESYPWSRIAEAFATRGLSLPRRVATTRSVQLLTTLVGTGQFLSILPRTVLHFCASAVQLKTLPVDADLPRYPVGIATLKNRTLNPTAAIFIEHAREVAGEFAEEKKRR